MQTPKSDWEPPKIPSATVVEEHVQSPNITLGDTQKFGGAEDTKQQAGSSEAQGVLSSSSFDFLGNGMVCFAVWFQNNPNFITLIHISAGAAISIFTFLCIYMPSFLCHFFAYITPGLYLYVYLCHLSNLFWPFILRDAGGVDLAYFNFLRKCII